MSFGEYSQGLSRNGFSCHIMISKIYGKVLTCFYERFDIFNICSFNIGNFSVIEQISFLFDNTIFPVNVHSDISKDKTKALICYSDSNSNSAYCLYYDINENKISSLTKYSDNCGKNPSSLFVYYFKQTKEFIFSCYSWLNTFTIVKFDENFNVISNDNSFIISNCAFDFVSII